MCDIGGIGEAPMLFVERLRRFYEETRFDALIFGLHDSLVLNFAQSLNRNLGLPENVAIATLFPYDYNNNNGRKENVFYLSTFLLASIYEISSYL